MKQQTTESKFKKINLCWSCYLPWNCPQPHRIHDMVTTLFQPQIESPGISSVKRGAVVFVRKQISSISNAKKKHATRWWSIQFLFIKVMDIFLLLRYWRRRVDVFVVLIAHKSFFFACDSRSNRCYRVVDETSGRRVNIISKSQQFQFGSSTDQIHFVSVSSALRALSAFETVEIFPARVIFSYLISRISLFFLLSLQQ